MTDLAQPWNPPAAEATGAALHPAARYALSAVMVVAATLIAFVVDQLINPPSLTLVFVIPVVIAATTLGLGPAMAAAALGVLAFDFFFTQPYFSLQIYGAADIWDAVLLLIIAVIVSAVAADARRRALASGRAADQARALQTLAHLVIDGRPRAEMVQAAAATLSRAFQAPAAIFLEQDGALRPSAQAGGGEIGAADAAAARIALETRVPVRADAYPAEGSTYDFWPLRTASGGRGVLAVNFSRADDGRPAAPEQFVEAVAAYLSVAIGGEADKARKR